jgi:catechol 2,3-dioxygenase-like lactoylglutathione lyase family enzyme
MLSDFDVMATVAVKDIDKAKRFYEEKLGLEVLDTGYAGGVLIYKCGNSKLLVYPSKYAGTNQATTATWSTNGDIEEIAGELKKRGVTFEHYYDMPDARVEGDIHYVGGIKGVWFKDPDGNILHVNSPAKVGDETRSRREKSGVAG